MEKIAILHCRNAAKTCTCAGCFKAYYDRSGSFQDLSEDASLAAFFDCSGCDADKVSDPGFQRKMMKLQINGIQKVYLATCVKEDCPNVETIKSAVEKAGISWVMGTH